MAIIKFFGQLREQIGADTVDYPMQYEQTLEEVLQHLAKKYPQWHDYLQASKVLCARNHEITAVGTTVSNNDEIAFFPPVTGG